MWGSRNSRTSTQALTLWALEFGPKLRLIRARAALVAHGQLQLATPLRRSCSERISIDIMAMARSFSSRQLLRHLGTEHWLQDSCEFNNN